MAGYRVTAGYVTAETAVPGGRAHVDIPRGSLLPDDVPAEQVAALLALGHLEPADAESPAPAEPGPEPDRGEPSNQEIRDWARANGLEVSDRGKIPAEIREAYTEAHE